MVDDNKSFYTSEELDALMVTPCVHNWHFCYLLREEPVTIGATYEPTGPKMIRFECMKCGAERYLSRPKDV